MNHNWVVPCNQLDSFKPLTMFNTLRAQLKSVGFWGKYPILGFIHGEFPDKHPRNFHVHAHLIIFYDSRPELEALLDKLKKRFYLPEHHHHKFTTPLLTRWLTPGTHTKDDFLRILSYVAKAYWNRIYWYWSKKYQAWIRGKDGRIPEPQHTQQLIWVDQFNPSQLRFLFGLKVVRHRLVQNFTAKAPISKKPSAKNKEVIIRIPGNKAVIVL
jgi:hypothetical protein